MTRRVPPRVSAAISAAVIAPVLAAGAAAGVSLFNDEGGDIQAQGPVMTSEAPAGPLPRVIPPELDTPGLPSPPVEQEIPDAPAGQGTFTMTGAVNMELDYASMPYALPLNPAGPQASMVRWVDGLGVRPENADQGTTYVLGHAWSNAPLAFNPISETVTNSVDFSSPRQAPAVDPSYLSIRYDPGYHTDTAGEHKSGVVPQWHSSALNGSRITIADGSGTTRTWVVDDAWLVDKYDALQDPDVMANVPGKVILIACSVQGELDLGYNVIVSGHLV